ncbi:NAD(P)-binding domain-containing protein [Kibdelosporangium aridum]|uniref:NAD(P)-binding domain-containing protein n=1 Tax=Kibdelosporangium aridum TaxID=2030 RepID=UPI0035E812D6
MVTTTDYLVIGAGPAGLQLAYFLQRAGRDYLVVEAGPSAGSFFTVFPRHRQLISINKPHTGIDDPEFNLRMDWNSLLSDDEDLLFTKYTERYFPDAGDMVRYLADYAERLELNIRYNAKVVEVSRGKHFRVIDHNGEVYEAPTLVVATGPAKPYLPDIPGIDLVELYSTVTVDPKDFTGQRVLIIGKGNSAFETADNLVETAGVIHVAGPTSVRFAWQTHYVGHLRAVNNNFLDTYQLKSQNAILDGDIVGVRKDGDKFIASVSFSRADEVVKDIPYDRVIACTGFRFDTSIFAENCTPELVIKGPLPGTDQRMAVHERAWPVLRGHGDAGPRLQEVHERVHPRLPLHREGAAPNPGTQEPRHAVAACLLRGRRERADGRDSAACQP